MAEENRNILYTIGHSNHELADFISLLHTHGVNCVADVRSSPYSRYCTQFNRETLHSALRQAGLKYIYMGDRLGARPGNANCYDGGHVNFEYLARTEEFKLGLDRLIKTASEYRLAMMCAEKEPLHCHRCILICRHLRGRGLSIKHILADGSIEDHADTESRLVKMMKIEPTLFEPQTTQADLIEQAYDRQAGNISHDSEPQETGAANDTPKP